MNEYWQNLMAVVSVVLMLGFIGSLAGILISFIEGSKAGVVVCTFLFVVCVFSLPYTVMVSGI